MVHCSRVVAASTHGYESVCRSLGSEHSLHACCRNFILQDDIEHFLPPEAAKLCFESLDMDGDGKVSLHDMREAVLKIYQNRKHLALTLKDTRTIVGKLERLVGSIIHFVWIFIYLSIWNVSCTMLILHRHLSLPWRSLPCLCIPASPASFSMGT